MGIIRFALALSVLIAHSDHSLGLQLLHSTVAVRSFYIISGFYMALVLGTKYRDKPYYVFLRSRYLRLFPAYCFILTLTFVYGLVTYYLKGTIEWPLQGWSRTITDLSPGTVLVFAFSNIFIFGQDILSFFHFDQSGTLRLSFSDIPTDTAFGGYMLIPQAWTLGIELLFYVAAPFLVTRSSMFILGVMLASLACKNLLFPAFGISPAMLGYRFFPFELIYFTLGALSFKMYCALKTRGIATHVVLAVALPLLFLYAAPQSGLPAWARYLSFAMGIPFIFLVSKNSRIDRMIGELSYPMYISHILVFYMLTQFTTWGTEIPGTVITIVLSFLVYQLIDKRVERWREALPDALPYRFPTAKELAVCIAVVGLSLATPLAARHLIESRHLAHSVPLASCDLLVAQPSEMVTVGLEPVESSGTVRWRWGYGPKTEMLFSLPCPVNITLTLEYAPLPMEQAVSIVFNDTVLETITSAGPGTVYRQYLLPGRKENNVVRFIYQDWNGRRTQYVPEDSRLLAAMFTRLDMSFASQDHASIHGGEISVTPGNALP